MKPIVSVIIPTYNRSTSLLKAIKSVLSQKKCATVEIIVVDDGSTDGTSSKVKKLAQLVPNLRYVLLPHSGGPGKPRNEGIKLARGEWVCFLDSDDLWLPHKLSQQLDFAKANNLSFVSTNAYKTTETKKTLYFPDSVDRTNISFAETIQVNPVICSSVMVKLDLLLQVQGFPEHSRFTAIEDYVCWLKIALSDDLGYLSTPLVQYIDHPKITIRNRWQNSKDQYRVLLPHIFAWYLLHLKLSYRYLSSIFPLAISWIKYI